MSYPAATQLVRSRRWFINPNRGFVKQLQSYQMELKDCPTMAIKEAEAKPQQTNYSFFLMNKEPNYSAAAKSQRGVVAVKNLADKPNNRTEIESIIGDRILNKSTNQIGQE